MNRFVLLSAGSFAVAALLLYGLYHTISGSGGATGSAPPERLRRLKADRDTQVLEGKWKLAEVAADFLREVDYFQAEVIRYKVAVEAHRRLNPGASALGNPIPFPDRVDVTKHRDLIQKAMSKFDAALEKYDLEVDRIQFRFYKDLSSLQGTDPRQPAWYADIPDPEADEIIASAVSLRVNLAEEFDGIISQLTR
jgi:hypothetical protein